jgi:serine/threonine protein kinase
MALLTGQRVGHYEILGLLGEGGMGQVYRARDTRLARVVALKVLAAAVAADAPQRARFEREAQAVASLNHANIVTIHSIEEADGLQFLTMELVEGGTLDTGRAGGLPLDRVLRVAIPLADAVAAAHQRGVTHRDLKPSNIMLTADGHVKVLDFGLAKLRDVAAFESGDETRMTKLTGESTVVGTAAYMSPEQAEGRPVDERSDIFSLGIVLYELATGDRPFTGDTSVSIVSSIIKDTPRPVDAVNPALPREFARIVRRCLVKDPEHRYQSAKDLRNELQELKQDVDSGELFVQRAPARPRSRTGMWIVAATVVATAGIGSVVWRSSGTMGPPTALMATFTQVTSQAGQETDASLSPDGKWIVYTAAVADGHSHIFLQSVGGQTPIDLTSGVTADNSMPVFSPDGEQIAFRSERQGGGLFVMGRTGEFARRASDTGFHPSWSPDMKSIAFCTERATDGYNRAGASQLWVVTLASGEKHRIGTMDASRPSWSPHGQRIAYYAGVTGQRDIFTVSLAGNDPVALTDDRPTDIDPVWAPDGRYLYFASDRNGTLNLWRAPIDEQTGAARGPFEAIPSPSLYTMGLTISSDGRRIAYAAIANTSNLQKFTFDAKSGSVTDKGVWITTGSGWRFQPDISPDGSRVAFRAGLAEENLFTAALDGSGVQQVTSDTFRRNRSPHWSPDGSEIAFYSNRTGAYEAWAVRPDGSALRQLTMRNAPPKIVGSILYPAWSPDGRRMAVIDTDSQVTFLFDPRKPWTEQTREQLPPLPGGGRLQSIGWSPDGRRLVGVATPTAGTFVYDLSSRVYDRIAGDVAVDAGWLDDDRVLAIVKGRLVLVDAPSKQARDVLSVGPDVIRWWTLSKDARTLIVSRGSNESDIWMATIK